MAVPILLVGLAGEVAGAGGAPAFNVIVGPPVDGQRSTFAAALNAGGALAGYAAVAQYEPTGVVIRADGLQIDALSSPRDSFNFPSGMNDAGDIVGVSGLTPCKWTGGVGEVLLHPPGFEPGFATDINNRGEICGSYIQEFPMTREYASYWADDKAAGVFLPDPEGASFSVAQGINESGQIVGAVVMPSLGRTAPAVWDTPTAPPRLLSGIPGTTGLSEGMAINDAGDVAGRSVYSPNVFEYEAFLYRADDGVTSGLGRLPGGTISHAFGVNNRREVVGDANRDSRPRGFLWKDGALHDLNDVAISSNRPYLAIISAVDINARGQIAALVALDDSRDPHIRAALLTPSELLRGDLNCDGLVNFDDIDPFVTALANPTGYAEQYPTCRIEYGDVDCDTNVNFDDIEGFVGCLVGACPACR